MDLLNRQRGQQPQTPGAKGERQAGSLQELVRPGDAKGPSTAQVNTQTTGRVDQNFSQASQSRAVNASRGSAGEVRTERGQREGSRGAQNREARRDQRERRSGDIRREQDLRADRADDQQAVVNSRRSQALATRALQQGTSERSRLDPLSQEALASEGSGVAATGTAALTSGAATFGVDVNSADRGAAGLTEGTSPDAQVVEFRLLSSKFAPDRGLSRDPLVRDVYHFFSNSDRLVDEEEREKAERAILEWQQLSPVERTREKMLEILQLAGVAEPTFDRISAILDQLGAHAPGEAEDIGARALAIIRNKQTMEKMLFDPSDN